MFLKQKGFTLIELLVVIAIIGILSTIAMTSLNGAKARARDARRKSDLNDMVLAIEQYYLQHGTYVVSGGGYNGGGSGWFNYQGGTTYVKSIANVFKEEGYLTVAPRDPKLTSDNQTPQYMLYRCGSGFYFYAKLEAPGPVETAAYEASCKSPNVTYGMNYAAGHR